MIALFLERAKLDFVVPFSVLFGSEPARLVRRCYPHYSLYGHVFSSFNALHQTHSYHPEAISKLI